jgi:rhodanese-related sulfurtransferase
LNLFSVTDCCILAKKAIMDLSQKDWTTDQQAAADSIILDVRTPEEYEAGHLPEAQLMDIRNPQGFMEGLASLDDSKTYFVYCRSGARSAQACQLMKQHGIVNCFNLLGGIMEWQGPVTT